MVTALSVCPFICHFFTSLLYTCLKVEHLVLRHCLFVDMWISKVFNNAQNWANVSFGSHTNCSSEFCKSLDRKQWNISDVSCCSEARYCRVTAHCMRQNGSDHDSLVWLGLTSLTHPTSLTHNWPFFFGLQPDWSTFFINGHTHSSPDLARCRTVPADHFLRRVTPISHAVYRWRQKVMWKVYLFAFSYFVVCSPVSDVKSCNILKLVKFPPVITNK